MKRIIALVIVTSIVISTNCMITTGYCEGLISGNGTATPELFIAAYNGVIEKLIQQFVEDESQAEAMTTLYKHTRDTSKDTDEKAVFTSFAGYEIYGYYQNAANGGVADKFEYVAKLGNPFPDWTKGEDSYLLNAMLIYNFIRLSLTFGNSDTEENQQVVWRWIINNERQTYVGDRYRLDYNLDID